MTFEEIEERFWALKGKLTSGRIDEPAFLQALSELAFTDGQGQQWRPDAESGKWLVERGGKWIEGTPSSEKESPQHQARPRRRPKPNPSSRADPRQQTTAPKADPKVDAKVKPQPRGRAPHSDVHTAAQPRRREKTPPPMPLREIPKAPASTRRKPNPTAPNGRASSHPSPSKDSSQTETHSRQVTADKCQQCGAPMQSDQLFCEECGSKRVVDQKAASGSNGPHICPHCHAPYAEGQRFCEECGKAIAATADSATAPPPQSTATTCAYCQAPLSPGQKFCEECGKPVSEPPTPNVQRESPAKEYCPQCRAPVAKGQRFCEECGSTLPAHSEKPHQQNKQAPAQAPPPPPQQKPIHQNKVDTSEGFIFEPGKKIYLPLIINPAIAYGMFKLVFIIFDIFALLLATIPAFWAAMITTSYLGALAHKKVASMFMAETNKDEQKKWLIAYILTYAFSIYFTTGLAMMAIIAVVTFIQIRMTTAPPR